MINIIRMPAVDTSSIRKVIRRNKAFTIEIHPCGIFNFYTCVEFIVLYGIVRLG